MSYLIKPELGIPMPEEVPIYDAAERTKAAVHTTAFLTSGAELPYSEEDEVLAAEIAVAYAANPQQPFTDRQISEAPSASLVMANNILAEFGKVIANDAVAIRHLVTNKLLIESDHPDPRIRMKALELLGKISDVGLFAEKREVTVTHRNVDEIRETLRSKLTRMMNGDVIEAEFEEPDRMQLNKTIALLDDGIDVSDDEPEDAFEDINVHEQAEQWDDE